MLKLIQKIRCFFLGHDPVYRVTGSKRTVECLKCPYIVDLPSIVLPDHSADLEHYRERAAALSIQRKFPYVVVKNGDCYGVSSEMAYMHMLAGRGYDKFEKYLDGKVVK